ncbi:hypothetical protein [Bacillus toyonensis]|uniref:Uncharacterized protein n=1 Tax=Bacillus toyonensis TaxID=155322 RepID=A0A2A8HBX3_9BACI|nr:hypothetical protein [Bacillus toyonensis]PEQ01699.1 hypothetical protein CN585_20950 [Bacillus toyonensis]
MKKFAIGSVVAIGLLGNSVMASASTVDYSQGKVKTVHQDDYTQKKAHNLAAVGGFLVGYAGGKALDAVGNWVGEQAKKANAKSIYSAAGKGKYACYRVANDSGTESVSSFGR